MNSERTREKYTVMNLRRAWYWKYMKRYEKNMKIYEKYWRKRYERRFLSFGVSYSITPLQKLKRELRWNLKVENLISNLNFSRQPNNSSLFFVILVWDIYSSEIGILKLIVFTKNGSCEENSIWNLNFSQQPNNNKIPLLFARKKPIPSGSCGQTDWGL